MELTNDRTSSEGPASIMELPSGQIAYRRFGATEGVPLVMCHRFRGTMDHWDPALLDALGAQRPVVVFDSIGVGRSPGCAPNSLEAMATIAAEFVVGLGESPVDLLGWSMGGGVAQWMALAAPTLVRRLVLAGTMPGGVPDSPQAPDRVWEVAGAKENNDDDFLYLFFDDNDASQAAGRAHLARLSDRSEPLGPQVHPDSVAAQFHALMLWGLGEQSTLNRLGEISQPVLVANGQRDRMVHAYNSFVMAQRLPHAELILYPDAGHGFLFQHSDRFARAVHDFLDAC